MSIYSIALFLHIVGALGFFVALAQEWTSIRQLRRATTAEQVRQWSAIASGVGRVGMISMLMLLLSGFYMMAIARVGGMWLIVAFWALVLLTVLALLLSRRRMAVIVRAATAQEGALPPALRQLLQHPLLWIGIQTRVAIALGIVFLMTVKPDLVGALLTIVIATLLGLAAALPRLRREPAQEEPAL